MKTARLGRDDETFYLYSPSPERPTLSSDTVFYRVAGEQSASALCRLFRKEYPSESEHSGFSLKSTAEVDTEEQILLNEAIVWLEVYDDPDPGIYDPPPPKDVMTRAQYARRAHRWEAMIVERGGGESGNRADEAGKETSNDTSDGEGDRSPEKFQMSPDDRRNSALNLLFLLAQSYYKILESVVSTATWFCTLDLELNESYLWTISNLKNLLANHTDLRDFPVTFEPAFPDLYPSTIRDVEWGDMVAPDVEQFLSTVQKYIRSKGVHSPEPSSPAWAFVELFRPSVETAIERAVAYDKRIRNHSRRVFGEKSGTVGIQNPGGSNAVKSAFISYSWDDDAHREWVRKLAERLRADGVDVSIDRWATVPGDQLSAFMERAIRDNQFVVIVCTPRYKSRSDKREGGVGYEGDIMTAEVLNFQNNRKFIPVLRAGPWPQAAPSWLLGKYYINLSDDPYPARDYEDLVRTLLGVRETAPPIGEPMATIASSVKPQSGSPPRIVTSGFEDIKITRVIVEEITEPRNDGTHGSALYSIPFALSAIPPLEWEQFFTENWNHPPQFTTMHRPGIASVSGATVVLNGTTIDEVERYHRDTLQLAIAETNRQYREWRREQDRNRERDDARREEHRKRIEDASKRIKFD